MLGRALKVGVLLAVIAAVGFRFALEHDPTLKLRVAVSMFGWSGLLSIVKESIGERLVGHKSSESRVAFHELLDTLGEAELKYLSPARGFLTEEDIAEGHRFLSHVLKAALEFQMEKEELFPHFGPFPTRTRKLLGDNPDSAYYVAAISADRMYKVSGCMNGEVYLSYTLAAAPCYGCFSDAVVGDVNHFNLTIQDDGCYELYVGKEKPANAANWLEVKPDEDYGQLQIISRHYYEHVVHLHNDPALTPNLTIELMGQRPPLGKARYRGDAWMADRLRRVAKFVTEHTVDMKNDPSGVPAWFSFESNVLGPPSLYRNDKASKDAGGGLGAVDIVYTAGPFDLKEGEGLKMVAKIPKDCIFVSVNLWNRYLQTLNYADRQVSLNRKQMRYESDGTVVIFISPVKPADPQTNWLDTEGRQRGTIFWRFVLCTEEIKPVSLTKIDVAQQLP